MSTWDDTRIADWRRKAEHQRAVHVLGGHLIVEPEALLSLLDELESVRRERDEARGALYPLAMMGMQSDRYVADVDFKEAVDAALTIVPPGVTINVLETT